MRFFLVKYIFPLDEVYFYTWRKHHFQSRERLKAHRLALGYNQSSPGDSRMTFKSLGVEFRSVRRKAFSPRSSRNFTIGEHKKKNFNHHEKFTIYSIILSPFDATIRLFRDDCSGCQLVGPTRLNYRQAYRGPVL